MCPVDKDLVRIGRHPSNDIVIDEIYVSGFHAELVRMPEGKYELVDLNSFNGTFVNCQRIQRSALQDGDTIAFALTQARFRLHAGPEAEAAGHAWSTAVRERVAVVPENGNGTFRLPQVTPAPVPRPQPAPQPLAQPAPEPQLPPVPAQPGPVQPVQPVQPSPLRRPPTPIPRHAQATPAVPPAGPDDGPKTLPLKPPLRLNPAAPAAPREKGACGLGCGVVLRFEPEEPVQNVKPADGRERSPFSR